MKLNRKQADKPFGTKSPKGLFFYIPNPKDRSKKEMKYLLEFENEALRLFQGILSISEFLYRLRQLELMFDGKVPIMAGTPISKPKKIGRNERKR